ncbi:rRNA adenine N-6-methyltransferase family protein [Bartonella sp. DGB1]|uniref:rRNA adenine N-6-methyltransferase family protein n=1 Tax=Bartonella sp. DGB1 TaxID=3239807 RepID=UPI003523545B
MRKDTPCYISKYEEFARIILQLRSLGVQNKEIFSALEIYPRQSFIPIKYDSIYHNGIIPIECGQYMENFDEQMIAIDKLDIQNNHNVLEIGTGSGFTAAIISQLAKQVVTIDRYKTLVELAKKKFEKFLIKNIFIKQADALKILPDPLFDRIIVWGAFPHFPAYLKKNLLNTGKMIFALGNEYNVQKLKLYNNSSAIEDGETIMNVRYQFLTSGCARIL